MKLVVVGVGVAPFDMFYTGNRAREITHNVDRLLGIKFRESGIFRD